MQEHAQKEEEFDIKKIFAPFTTTKAIHWIVIIGLIVYANMLFNGFVWDDLTYIINNPTIHSFNIVSILNSFKESLFNSGGEYRPITAIYFLITYAFFGNSPFFYHFIQLSLHIVNTILIFILFAKFFSRKISLFLSVIFLIHPMQVEAISYIASTGNPLFFLFGIIALLIGISNNVDTQRQIVIFCLLLLSLFARETGILFLLLIIFYRILFNKKQTVSFLIFSLITLSIYLFARIVIGGIYLTKLDLVLIARLSLLGRLINIPAIFFYYIKTFFIPITLSVDQQWIVQKINYPDFYFPLLIDLLFLVAIGILGIYISKKRKEMLRVFLFFSVWFLTGVAFHLQIVPLDFTVSDRWFYFPMVGLLGIIAIVIQLVGGNYKKVKIAAYIGAIIIVLLFSFRTIVRNTNWQNQLTLFTHDITLQDNFDSENNLGSAYTQIGDAKKALIHYEKSVSLLPNDTNLFNLGYTYQQLNNLSEAKKYYVMVVENRNSHSTIKSYAFQALGFMYINSNPKLAKEYSLMGLQEYPNNGSLYSILAISEYRFHDRADALIAAEKAKVFLPNEETYDLYLLILNNKPLHVTDNH